MDRENPREIQDRLAAGRVLNLGQTDYETTVIVISVKYYIHKNRPLYI